MVDRKSHARGSHFFIKAKKQISMKKKKKRSPDGSFIVYLIIKYLIFSASCYVHDINCDHITSYQSSHYLLQKKGETYYLNVIKSIISLRYSRQLFGKTPASNGIGFSASN